MGELILSSITGGLIGTAVAWVSIVGYYWIRLGKWPL